MPLSSDPAKRARQIANLRRAPSDDPVVRERQLANLRPAPPAPEGNSRRLVHGGRSELLLRDVEPQVRELMDALGDSAPVRDEAGSLPTADVIAVEAAARALKRYRQLATWLDTHGRIKEKTGGVKPAAELEIRAERQLNDALDRLGMNPMARSRLGLNLSRAQHFDLAQAWAEVDVVDGEVTDDD